MNSDNPLSKSLSDTKLLKGLHGETFEEVWCFMKKNNHKVFTSIEVAEALGLSKVTARRYLGHLTAINEVE